MERDRVLTLVKHPRNTYDALNLSLYITLHNNKKNNVHQSLPSLELRRLYLDLVFCYKVVFGLVSINFDDYYVAAKATYIRLLHGKIGILEGFFGPSSVHRGRTHIVFG